MSAPSRAEGSYRAMIDRLDHLVETGITALELMPLADFAGSRNWGYDGVLWYAPDSAYGRPDDLKALIDAAHLRGLMVMLDVVYNHFGPEGNYLGRYAPSFFTEAQTPWGSAIDYRVREVRAFAIENALHWLRDYRFDGLRLDAVQRHRRAGRAVAAARSQRAPPASSPRKPAGTFIWCWKTTTTAPACWMPREDPPQGKYRAQWNDDYHHAWHVLMTGEKPRLLRRLPALADLGHRPLAGIRLRLSGRSRRRFAAATRGEPSGHLAPTAFINFLQNHDQIGNRALGDRLEGAADARAIEAALAVTAAGAACPDAVHGRGMGLESALPVLLRFRRRSRRRRPQGPPQSNWPGPMRNMATRSPIALDAIDLRIRGARLGRARRRPRHASG